MPWPNSRLALLLAAVPFAAACAAGSDEGLSGFTSAGVTAGPAGDSGDTTAAAQTDDASGSAEGPTTASSADGTSTSGDPDVGNPLCCEPGGQAGCESEVTEACVCTSQPSCCQAVWGSECVELAIGCGDPYCTDDSGSGSDDAGTDTGVMLECDADFAFMPANPAPGVAFTAAFSDPVGLTWVGMTAEGAGGAVIEGSWGGVTGSGPFTWSYGFGGLAAGVWTFAFTHRETEGGADLVRGTCQKQI